MKNRSLWLALALSVLAHRAAAQSEVASCVEDHKRVQTAREAGRYLESRDAAAHCAQPSCPQLIREDCAAWYVDLAESTPSIVLVVRDHAGRDVADAQVMLGDRSLDAHGRAVALDPGSHELRVEATDYAPRSEHIVLREGEKNRRVAITLQPVHDVREQVAPRSAPRFSPAVITLGVVGLVGLSTFVALAVSGKVQRDRLDEDHCKPSCARADVDYVNRVYVAADIAAALGGSAAIAATVLHVLDRRRERRLQVGLNPLGVSLRGAF